MAFSGVGYKSTVITTNTTTTILNAVGPNQTGGNPTNKGILQRVIIGVPGASGGSVIAYDNNAGSGTQVLNVAVGAAALTPTYLEVGVQLNNGLTIVTAGMTSPNVTVLWE